MRVEFMHWPKISIVTPSYNQGQFLEETIRSVITQNYPNLEYIITDGGSTDNSLEIIKKYEEHLAYWVSEKDKGQSHAINKGFAKATGDIFAWLNSDDIYRFGVLHRVAEYWINNPDCHFLAGDGEIVNNSGYKLEYYIKACGYSFKELLYYHQGKYLAQPSIFFSKTAFIESNGLDENLKYAMDLDLWLRISQKYNLNYLGLCLSRLRHHVGSSTYKNNEVAMKEIESVIKRYLNKTNISNRFLIKTGLRSLRAEAACRSGLEEYFHKNYDGAINHLNKAIKLNPFTLFSRQGLKLTSRLFLPNPIKRHIFAKP